MHCKQIPSQGATSSIPSCDDPHDISTVMSLMFVICHICHIAVGAVMHCSWCITNEHQGRWHLQQTSGDKCLRNQVAGLKHVLYNRIACCVINKPGPASTHGHQQLLRALLRPSCKSNWQHTTIKPSHYWVYRSLTGRTNFATHKSACQLHAYRCCCTTSGDTC
jgi:hypothetical protein